MLPTRRKELCDYLNKYFLSLINKKDKLKQISNTLEEKYGIDQYYSPQILTMSTDITLENDETLFCFLSVINEKEVPNYFTETEIKKMSNINFKKEDNKELKFKCIQISDDQWTGRIEVEELIRLADNNMLHYESSTQRIMKKKNVGGIEYYTATVNEKAVKQIMESMQNGTYIPNTITLNLPIDQAIPYYDEETCTLYVEGADYLDIIDGYHRYIAMNRLHRNGFVFTKPMEIRITNFESNKAKMFIFQEDQKTKMKKVDSNSFNIAAPENKVMELLKKEVLYAGVFDKTSIIDPSYLSAFLKEFFVGVKKEDQLKKIVKTKNDIVEKLTELVVIHPEILEEKWKESYILAFAYIIYKDMDISEIDALHEKILGVNKSGRFYNRAIYNLNKCL